MTLEDEIARRIWRTRIGNLAIADHIQHNSIRISRPGGNRYVVYKNGVRKEFGGRNTSVLTASLQVLAYVTDIDEPLLCSRCGKEPRLPGTSHCKHCRSAIASKANQKRKHLAALLPERAS